MLLEDLPEVRRMLQLTRSLPAPVPAAAGVTALEANRAATDALPTTTESPRRLSSRFLIRVAVVVQETLVVAAVGRVQQRREGPV